MRHRSARRRSLVPRSEVRISCTRSALKIRSGGTNGVAVLKNGPWECALRLYTSAIPAKAGIQAVRPLSPAGNRGDVD